MVKIDINTPK